MTFLVTKRSFKPGDVVTLLGNTSTQRKNPGRIQVDNDRFILPPKDVYHSCQPNGYIDWNTMELIALVEITKNTLITYHYGTSEDDYRIGAFDCTCGSVACIKYLTTKQRDKIKDKLSPFLREKYYGETRF